MLSVREGFSVDVVVNPSRGNSQLKMGQFTAQNGCGCVGLTNYIGRKSKSGYPIYDLCLSSVFYPLSDLHREFGLIRSIWGQGGYVYVPYALGA